MMGWQMAGQVAGMGASVLDGLQTNAKTPSIGMSAAKGALSGVAAGAAFGPWGAAIGGVVGGAAGAITGSINKGKEERTINRNLQTIRQTNLERGAAAVAADPSLAYGNAGVNYYANGGRLNNPMNAQPQVGGQLKPLSSEATEVEGPSHEQGGVELPGMDAELEGGETTSGNKVFSEQLGFAQLHKPIAKAIGKIETKPFTHERVNALRRLKDKEEELFQQQEFLKQALNTY